MTYGLMFFPVKVMTQLLLIFYYLQFHHVPLFLEWAPMEVFTSAAGEKVKDKTEKAKEAEDEKEDKTEKMVSI